MAEIFFSYSHTDRERVRPIRDALAEMGFEVFWDQQTPSGSDWDTWIRGELAKAKCAMVFWSSASATSHNVRHEAEVARDQRKLISVLLEPIRALDLPMGFYHQQAADLSNWKGDRENEEWRKFRFEFEEKLMPRWARQRLNRLEAELVAERARCEEAEGRDKEFKTQIAKEARTQQGLKRERDSALAQVAELKAEIEQRDTAFETQTAKQVETEKGLTSERDKALSEATKLSGMVEELTQAHSDAQKRLLELSQRLSEAELQHSEDVTERDGALAEVAELKAKLEELTPAPSGIQANQPQSPPSTKDGELAKGGRPLYSLFAEIRAREPAQGAPPEPQLQLFGYAVTGAVLRTLFISAAGVALISLFVCTSEGYDKVALIQLVLVFFYGYLFESRGFVLKKVRVIVRLVTALAIIISVLSVGVSGWFFIPVVFFIGCFLISLAEPAKGPAPLNS